MSAIDYDNSFSFDDIENKLINFYNDNINRDISMNVEEDDTIGDRNTIKNETLVNDGVRNVLEIVIDEETLEVIKLRVEKIEIESKRNALINVENKQVVIAKKIINTENALTNGRSIQTNFVIGFESDRNTEIDTELKNDTENNMVVDDLSIFDTQRFKVLTTSTDLVRNTLYNEEERHDSKRYTEKDMELITDAKYQKHKIVTRVYKARRSTQKKITKVFDTYKVPVLKVFPIPFKFCF